MKTLFLLYFVLFSIYTHALKFGEPVYSGSGCPSNSISWTLSPDNTSLSLLTGSFTINTNNGTVWSHCELIVPISIDSPGLVKGDFRGFHNLPNNALHETLITHQPIGGPGTANSQNYLRIGTETDNFFHSHLFNVSFGSQTAFRLIVSSLMANPSTTESASLSLDSIDLSVNKNTFAPTITCNSAAGLQASAIIAAIIGMMSML